MVRNARVQNEVKGKVKANNTTAPKEKGAALGGIRTHITLHVVFLKLETTCSTYTAVLSGGLCLARKLYVLHQMWGWRMAVQTRLAH